MKAVAVHGKQDLRLDELPASTPGRGEVLVRVAYGGICGSDLHYRNEGRNGIFEVREPLVLGHEVVGVVVEHGPGVDEAPPVGAPVAIHPALPTPLPGERPGRKLHLVAGGSYLGSASTRPHTQGGFREYIPVRPEQLRAIPASLPLQRAVLAEPLAVALHGVDRFAGDYEGLDVLVSGAGPIGCLVVAALRHRGAGSITVTDLHEAPLQRARAVGADTVVLLGRDAAVEPRGFDVVVEASGSSVAARGAHELVRVGGTIIQVGIPPAADIPLPLSAMVSREITLLGSQRFDVELDEALELLAVDASLGAVITDVFPIEHYEAAFDRASDSASSGKVVLEIAHP